ncbi:gluconokinase [Paracoccus onubensis]|uniref:Gluconokinase n=1 Tax=Paracoccus onubensis TaxID=1675788 RepID=A0A418SN50_9RHOB|nr:gluconokinase [Paracoccus onubensis]
MTASPSGKFAVVVMGVSGCGKSTLAVALADALCAHFLESDSLHPTVNIAKMSAGRPLTDADREPWLEHVGREILHLKTDGVVASCSALRHAYRDKLREVGGTDLIFVHMVGTFDLIRDRVTARRGHFMPVSLLRDQFSALESPSRGEAVIEVPIAASTEEQTKIVLNGLRQFRCNNDTAPGEHHRLR